AVPRCRYTPSPPTRRRGPLAVRTTPCCLLLACTLTGLASVPGSRPLQLSSKNGPPRASPIPRASGARSALRYRSKRKKTGRSFAPPSAVAIPSLALWNDRGPLVRVDAFHAVCVDRRGHVVVGLAGLHIGVGVAHAADRRGVNLRIGAAAYRTAIDVVAGDRRWAGSPVERNRVVDLRSRARSAERDAGGAPRGCRRSGRP